MWFWIFLGIAVLCGIIIFYILENQIEEQHVEIKKLKMQNKFLTDKINELNIATNDTV